MSRDRVLILDVMVDGVTMDAAVEQVEAFIDQKKSALIATANAEMIMMAQQDDVLKQILNDADLVVPDGAGTVWAANYLGFHMTERVAGFDLVQRLLARAPKNGTRVFFLGSAPGIAEQAKVTAEKNFPGINIVGVQHGYFSDQEEVEIVNKIKAAKPDLLLVALGVPRQEKWIKKYLADLDVAVAIGVGGTLDVMAGAVKRAPLWLQQAKLEWLYRGLLQPKRIGRLIALPKFVLKVRAYKKH